MEARRLEPGKLVELECVDALHVHAGLSQEIRTEWIGTRLLWHLERASEGATVRFEHVGLTPTLLCYDVCQAGWDYFFVASLKSYLDTGKGTPHGAALGLE